MQNLYATVVGLICISQQLHDNNIYDVFLFGIVILFDDSESESCNLLNVIKEDNLRENGFYVSYSNVAVVLAGFTARLMMMMMMKFLLLFPS